MNKIYNDKALQTAVLNADKYDFCTALKALHERRRAVRERVARILHNRLNGELWFDTMEQYNNAVHFFTSVVEMQEKPRIIIDFDFVEGEPTPLTF